MTAMLLSSPRKGTLLPAECILREAQEMCCTRQRFDQANIGGWPILHLQKKTLRSPAFKIGFRLGYMVILTTATLRHLRFKLTHKTLQRAQFWFNSNGAHGFCSFRRVIWVSRILLHRRLAGEQCSPICSARPPRACIPLPW